MAYMLENESGAHTATVLASLHSWGKEQPDVHLVSEQGAVIMTHRVFLKLYSGLLDSALQTFSSDSTPSIFVPASTHSLINLIKVLSTGYSMASDKEELLDVLKTAELIGISMKGVQIGTKKKSKTNASKDEKDAVANGVKVKPSFKENEEAVENETVKKKRKLVKVKGDNLQVKKENRDLSYDGSNEGFASKGMDSEDLETNQGQGIGGNEDSENVGCEEHAENENIEVKSHDQPFGEISAGERQNIDSGDEDF